MVIVSVNYDMRHRVEVTENMPWGLRDSAVYENTWEDNLPHPGSSHGMPYRRQLLT